MDGEHEKGELTGMELAEDEAVEEYEDVVGGSCCR